MRENIKLKIGTSVVNISTIARKYYKQYNA